MHILTKAQRNLHNFAKTLAYGFLVPKAQTERDFSALVWWLRFAVLLVLIFRFGINKGDYVDSMLFPTLQFLIATYFLYILFLGYLIAFRPHQLLFRKNMLLQTTIDIMAFSVFYFLTKDAQSDVFILYFLPLIVSAQYFGFRITLAFFVVTIFAFSAVLLGIATLFQAYPPRMIERVFIPRAFFLAVITFAYLLLYGRRMRELASLREASIAITSTLNMNDVLQSILAQLGQVVPYDSASIQLLTGDSLEIIACCGFEKSDKVLELAFPLDPRFPNYHVIVMGVPYIVDDVRLEYPHFQAKADVYQSANIRSWLGVPLLSKGEVLGMMSSDKNTVGFYNDDHGRLAEAFANQAAIAIENAQLYEQAQGRVSELTALQKVGLEMVSSLESSTVLDAVAESALGLIAPNDVYIFLYDEATGQFAFGTSLWASGERRKLITMPRKDGLTARVAKQGKPLIVNDAEHHPLYSSPDAPRHGVKAIAGFPLKRAGRVLGVLNVTFLEPHTFNEDELRVLAMLADQAAMSIENARLYEEMVGQKNRLQEYLSTTSKKLVEHTDLEGLFVFITSAGAKFLDAEDCSLYLVNEENHTIAFVASSYLPAYLFGVKKTPIDSKPGAGLTAYAAATGEILNFVGDDFQKHPAWSGEFRQHLKHFRSGRCDSLLIVPMRYPNGDIVGVLKIENKLGKQAAQGFSGFDKESLILLANQAAIAIERVRMYQQISEEAAHKERERLQGDLHEAMNIFHAAVMLKAEILADKLRRQKYEAVQIGLEQLWRGSRFAYTELDNILQDLRSPILEEEGLVPALKACAQTVGREYVFVEGDAQVRFPIKIEHALYRIGQGAISNALKHAGLDDIEGGRVQVKMTVISGIVTLSIEDNGRGFGIDVLESRGDWFGLRRMEERAKSIGGRLKIQPVPGQGTTVTVTVALKGA